MNVYFLPFSCTIIRLLRSMVMKRYRLLMVQLYTY